MQTTEEPRKGELPTARPAGAAGTAGETQGDEAELEAELFGSEEDESEEESGLEASEDEDEADQEGGEEDEIIMEAEAEAILVQPEIRESSALDLLIRQHREVDALFDEIEGGSDKAKRTRERLVETLVQKLELHTKIEEKVFYPGVKEVDEDLVLESFEEHDLVKFAARKLQKTAPGDESFDARLTTLKELVEHHVQEEETELFPRVREELGDEELAKLGKRMTAMVEQGRERPARAASGGSRKQAQPKAASRQKARSSGSKARAKPAAKGRSKSSAKSTGRSSRGKTSASGRSASKSRGKSRSSSGRRATRH